MKEHSLELSANVIAANRPSAITPKAGAKAYFYPQLWLLLISLIGFAVYVAWDLNLFSLILSLDKSYMASVTMGLVLVMSLHCGWHIVQFLRWSHEAENWLVGNIAGSDQFINQFISDSTRYDNNESEQNDSVLEIYADRARAPVDLGWFFVDLAVRLGLLGTIVGFILIFASLDNISLDGGDDLTNLLIAMSGGMGTALYTTLTGLVGASLLSFQYLILGRQSEHYIAQLLRIRLQLHHQTKRSPS